VIECDAMNDEILDTDEKLRDELYNKFVNSFKQITPLKKMSNTKGFLLLGCSSIKQNDNDDTYTFNITVRPLE
jgi:hypothetical protein